MSEQKKSVETRKVQLVSGSTYTVSLPKQWASEHDIEAGDRLHLDPRDDGSLIVRTGRERTSERTVASVTIDHHSYADTVRTVRALHAVGFDAFTLRASKPLEADAKRSITAATSKLIGLEVMEASETRLTLRSLLNTADVSIRQTVIQLQLVALSMQRDAIRALSENDTNLATHVIERDDEADQLFSMVDRHFQRALTDLQEVNLLELNRPTLFSYYRIARNLERIADHAEKIATITTRIDNPRDTIIEDIAAVARRSHSVVEDATSVLLAGGSNNEAYRALAARDDLLNTLEAFNQRLYCEDISDAYLLGLVLDSIKRTAEYGGNIAETAIQHTYREEGSTQLGESAEAH
jgi:phosphate uptake regulator